MTFEKSRVPASMVLACALAWAPSRSRAAAPGDAPTQPPASAPAASDEPSAPVETPAPAPAPSEAAKTEAAPIPPPRPVAEDKLDTLPTTEVRTCFVRGRDVCKSRKIMGAVSLALGIASAGSGVALTLVKSKTIADDPSFQRAYLPAGLVLVGASVLLVTMGGMLIGDAVQRRRGPKARFAWRTR